MRGLWFLTLLLAVVLAGCGPNSDDVKELLTQQREILAKLRDIEKKLDQGAARPAAAARDMPDPNKVHELPAAGSAVRGPVDAPVTITEFSDYQCPFCSRAEPLIEEVLKAYPKQVKLVFKNFPLTSIHPYAMGAAQAAVAAGKQGKYWQMHGLLFANQRELSSGKLKEYATQIGLDVPKWEQDMGSPEVASIISDDMKLAAQASVRGTPTFFVNGKQVQARSVDGFKTMIDAALKEQQKS